MARPQSLVMEEAGLLASATGKQRDEHKQLWRRAVAQLWRRAVFLGTRLFPLFTAVPLAVAAEHLRLGRVNFRSLSLSLSLLSDLTKLLLLLLPLVHPRQRHTY
jgi:hypothetical protein